MANMRTEDDHQVAYTKWIRSNPFLQANYFHVANERKCSVGQGWRLKNKGVRSGVSDICVMYPVGQYHGLFIELKIGRNKISDAQAHFLDDMRSAGYATRVCYGYLAAVDCTLLYLDGLLEVDKTNYLEVCDCLQDELKF